MSLLSGKHIVLGITGGIAAYKSAELVRRLREQGAVLRWLAGALGAPPPRAVRAKDPALRARRDNKRCRNDRLLASGYTFLYPTYREGYRAMLEEVI